MRRGYRELTVGLQYEARPLWDSLSLQGKKAILKWNVNGENLHLKDKMGGKSYSLLSLDLSSDVYLLSSQKNTQEMFNDSNTTG